jgi:hypothetical protein
VPQHVRRTAHVYALRLPDNRHYTRLLGTPTTRTTHCPRLRPPPSRQSTLHALARHDHNTYDALSKSTPSAFPTIDTPRACSSRPQHVRRTAQVYALRLSDTRHSTCLLVTTTTRTTHCPSLRPPPSRHSTLHELVQHYDNKGKKLSFVLVVF